MSEHLAFLGLGTMGLSMARNLLEKGFSLAVWNRNSARAESLGALGANVASTPNEAVDGASIVFTCVTNGKALREVLETALQAKSLPQLVVDHSTIDVSEAVEIAAWLNTRGVEFLDAPVTGGDVGAKNGTLTIMVGGKLENLERARPALEAMGKKVVFMGESGSGQRAKCVNQIACAGAVAAMSEALSFAETAGLNLPSMLDILRGGAAGSWSLDNYGPRVLKGDFAPGFLAEHMLKDLHITLKEAELSGARLPLTTLLAELYIELTDSVPPGTVGNHGLSLLYRKMNQG